MKLQNFEKRFEFTGASRRPKTAFQKSSVVKDFSENGTKDFTEWIIYDMRNYDISRNHRMRNYDSESIGRLELGVRDNLA